MGAEQRRGDVGCARRTRKARKEEVWIAASALVAAFTGNAGAGGLAAEQQRRTESRAADLDQIGLIGVAGRAQALGPRRTQGERAVGPRRQPPGRMDHHKIGRPRARQRDGGEGQDESAEDQDACGGGLSIQRRRSSTSTQPKVQISSRRDSMCFAPAMSPRTTISSP